MADKKLRDLPAEVDTPASQADVAQLVRRDSGDPNSAVPVNWSAMNDSDYVLKVKNAHANGKAAIFYDKDGNVLLDISGTRAKGPANSPILTADSTDTVKNKTLDASNNLSAAIPANLATFGPSGMNGKKIAAGEHTFSWSGGLSSITQSAGFGYTFGSTPMVVATARDATNMYVIVVARDTSGFDFRCVAESDPGNGADVRVAWIAIG